MKNNNYYESKKLKKGYKRAVTYLVLFGLVISSAFICGCTNAQDFLDDGARLTMPGIAEGVDNEIADTEGILENPIIKTEEENVSTFSIDVDTASYVNLRRYLKEISLEDFQKNNFTVRTEEAINYFDYDYKKPTGDLPIAASTTVGACPWNDDAKLAVISLAGKELESSEQAGSNIVFLIDISGSMMSDNKLPLLKKSLEMAVNNLNEKDTVSIVTYAGNVDCMLDGAKGNEKTKIINAISRLESGGSTAGASGLNLAYSVAEDYFIKDGNNRILLATDGDFNVGPSSVEEMEELVTEKRESGVFLTVLGFGVTYSGGDQRLEVLADNGNGGYYVIDCIEEGEKVLCDQFEGCLYTVAKDVKVQVEFNKDNVESYRLIGYENRVLNNEDFEDDTKDAGDMGAGQTVTAVYELILKEDSDDLFTVNIRYKEPNSDESKLYEHTAGISGELSDDYYFISSVIEACLVINNSNYKGDASLENAHATAKEHNKNNDTYKKEFIDLLNKIK